MLYSCVSYCLHEPLILIADNVLLSILIAPIIGGVIALLICKE